jgi:aminoglycoside/choline kinase family phosphotransferase
VVDSSDVQILPLAGDASNRRYYRIVSDSESWVLMKWEPFVDDESYPFLSVLNHFAKHGVQVPAVIGKAPDLGLILLEDLGDLTLERKFWENQDHSVVLPFYKQALDELVKIHYLSTADRETCCTAFHIEFNVERLLWEMNYGREHLVKTLAKIDLSQIEQKELDRIFTEICIHLDEEPKLICHRDYHSRNVMLKFGKARIIDFQDARLGPVQYDLVSLLKDSYVNWNDEMSQELLNYYLEKRKSYILKPLDPEHFRNNYERQSLQRCFKACGSFASFYNLRQDTRYLKYLSPTIKRIHASLEFFPEYAAFSEILYKVESATMDSEAL